MHTSPMPKKLFIKMVENILARYEAEPHIQEAIPSYDDMYRHYLKGYTMRLNQRVKK